MSIQIICDNCQLPLRNEPDTVGAEPEPHCKLRLEANSKTLMFMDLCLRCAKKYVKVLSDPV